MRKILLSILLVVGVQASVFAETIKVRALSDFDTVNPPKTLEVQAVTDMLLDKGFLMVNEGYMMIGDIVDVKSPKRLKRDASFSFLLTEYTDNNGNTYQVNDVVKGTYTTKFDVKSTAKSAALGVGNHFVKGISAAYSAVEGVVKNEEGNRLKSGAVAVYDNSPVSYVEKGEDIFIKENQIFILKFKYKDNSDEPNYTYTEPEYVSE